MILQAQITGQYVTLLLTGVGVLVALSVGVIFFFVVYQRRIFAQERLRIEVSKRHQLELLTAAVEVQETERSRIAGDLHDDIGSLLTATRLYLRQLKAGGSTQQINLIKDQSLEIVDEMIQNTRRISHDLLPPALSKFGFRAAAEDLCERFDQTEDLTVVFNGTSAERLPPNYELALYRVLQELLNNTIKYAGAQHVTVTLRTGSGGTTEFTYTDDGRGFDPASARGGGLGMRNIESRITVLAGQLDFQTAPGQGVRVIITLPPNSVND